VLYKPPWNLVQTASVSVVLAASVVQTSHVQSGIVKVKSHFRLFVCQSTTDLQKPLQLTASSVSKYGSIRKKKSQEHQAQTTVEAVEVAVEVDATNAVDAQSAKANAKANIEKLTTNL
jgi:3-deoxy-D-manno-octulosonic-acid transferase